MATDEDLQKINQITSNISQGLNTINMINMAENEAISKQKQLEFVQQRKEINEQNKTNISTQIKTLANDEEEAEARIENSLKNIKLWNVNAEDFSTLDEQYTEKTEDGESILKDLGLEYAGNFQLNKNIANNVKDQIKINRNYVNIADKMAAELSNIEQSFVDLRNEAVENLVDVAGISGMIDEDDVEAYMRADTKGEGGTSRFYDAEGNITPIGRVFSQPMKQVSGVDIGTWDKKRVQKVQKDIMINELSEKAGAVVFASDNLRNLEDDDKLKKGNEGYHDAVGTHAMTFSGSKSDWALNSFETNKTQKNSLNKSIIKGLKYAQAGNASKRMNDYLNEFDGASLDRQEEIVYNITQMLVPTGTDLPLGTRFGKGFKKGSGMEKADFDQDGMFNQEDTYEVGENHMLGMLQQWLAVDNMYPDYQSKYKNDLINDKAIKALMQQD